MTASRSNEADTARDTGRNGTHAASLARVAPPLDVVVSPYHLTTREPAAIVAAQLCESITTLLIAPRAESRDAVQEAAIHAPAYRRFMESWEWAMTLFAEGLVGSRYEGVDPVEDVRDACAVLDEDPAYAGLSPFLRAELFRDDTVYLNAASADILKAGPDPAVSIPIAAGLDRFAAGTDTVVIRSAPASVVQKREFALGRVLFRTSVPAIVQGSAERILLLRALLEDERTDLAGALSSALREGDTSRVRASAVRYADAFERERDDITAPPGPNDEDEVRVIVGEASLVGVELPLDAALAASLAAATGRPPEAALPPGNEPRVVRTLIVRSIGGR